MKSAKKSGKSGRAVNLVTNRLENVSKDVFTQHFALITELVGDSPGIYALYDGDDLYYVGKSSELRTRVRHHLKDRHVASWTHFSLYLVSHEEHIHEIESLLVRIANPKGNRIVPRGKSAGMLVKKLKSLIRKRQKEELTRLFAPNRKMQSLDRRGASGRPASLIGLVEKKTPLFRTYKANEYKAMLGADGIISIGGKKYTSASAAARAVISRKSAVNGWNFWYIQNQLGDWVRLADYRK